VEAVTSVLLERSHAERGLPRMVTLSLVGHVVLAAGLLVAAPFIRPATEQDTQPVMTISLGGAPGPKAGGMTMMGRPIESMAPLPEVPRPAPIRDTVTKPPEMTLPAPVVKPVKPSKPRPTAAEAIPTKDIRPAPAAPTQTAATATAAAVTGEPRGLGFGGLSTGGGAGSGSFLEVANFCCPDYLVTMQQLIQGNWYAKQDVGGETMVLFRIQRDGRLTDIELEKSSGYPALDIEAQRALFKTRKLPPLPSAFPDDSLKVHLRFEYTRR
jgi:TonB family protein